MINLVNGSCNTLDDLSDRICVPNKTEDVNLSVFNMIIRINELKTLANHISCKCKCKFDNRKCKSNQKWVKNKCQCDCKNPRKQKNYIWNPSTCTCENGKYFEKIIGDSVIT